MGIDEAGIDKVGIDKVGINQLEMVQRHVTKAILGYQDMDDET